MIETTLIRLAFQDFLSVFKIESSLGVLGSLASLAVDISAALCRFSCATAKTPRAPRRKNRERSELY
jgi:hypothetical protein